MQGAIEKLFKIVKNVFSSPVTVISYEGFTSCCLLVLHEQSLDTLLALEVEGVEHPIFYLSRSLRGVEMNYSVIEQHYYIFYTEPLAILGS